MKTGKLAILLAVISKRSITMSRLLLVLLICGSAVAADSANDHDDILQIKRLVEVLWAERWQAGDAQGLASLFTEDADFVTANGYIWQGREEIERGFEIVLSGPFREATLEQHVEKIQFIDPKIAIVHVWLKITWPDGNTRRDRGDRLFIEDDGIWRCLALQNSPIVSPPESVRGRLPGTQEPLNQ